jgi:hypothetical protein
MNIYKLNKVYQLHLHQNNNYWHLVNKTMLS